MLTSCLDEPSNYLDVVNVAWLENCLASLKTCTSIIALHDSSFLNVITGVLHLNRFKLKRHRGKLEAFMKAVPETRSYCTLEAAEDYRSKLPDPPFLDGVKTRYPTSSVQQLYDITLQNSHFLAFLPSCYPWFQGRAIFFRHSSRS
ncbi:hypothetical protein L227DRAFT_610505 [Lentinus tigrinus ALCF2SS1-6]|uniref:Uncharacterized protein n=1 Tax=Lentinus tigrinus ALCF2SS1-6 TaxID=1328759 RepID=A0A5C2SCG5_9APHY|nr:hypothetical protein L227DRAFT_610505 [Lentinus tigrinus ALCF2SS1-6]